MGKVIMFDQEARQKIFNGLDKMVKCVRTTMGAFGYNVILDNLYTVPEVVNDWVTVINSMDFDDRYENIAAFMLKKACNDTNRQAGDGTTTCAVLSHAITKEGLKYINSGVNPFKLWNAMNIIAWQVKDYIQNNAVPVKDIKDIKNVATISAQDDYIGGIITEAFDKVGDGGVVTVEETRELGISIEMKSGLEFDEPLKSMALITNPQRRQCELEDAYVFVSERKLPSLKSIDTVLKQITETDSRSVIFIVDDIDISALHMLILNHQRGNLKVCVVKAPSYGQYREEFYTDVCALTGATLISDKTGLNFKDVMIWHLGQAKKVVSWRAKTLIVWGNENEAEKQKIVDGLKADIARTTDDFAKMKKEQRLAKLTGGIATILVWFPSDVETNNKRLKIEDAVNAVRAALEEWVIYWSGISLIEAMDNIHREDYMEFDVAYDIMKKALEYPTMTIMNNAGVGWDYVVQSIRSNQYEKGTWYDIKNGSFVKLLDVGVIDPAKVIRVALSNAVSLANMILTSKSVVTEDPKKEIDHQDAQVS